VEKKKEREEDKKNKEWMKGDERSTNEEAEGEGQWENINGMNPCARNCSPTY